MTLLGKEPWMREAAGESPDSLLQRLQKQWDRKEIPLLAYFTQFLRYKPARLFPRGLFLQALREAGGAPGMDLSGIYLPETGGPDGLRHMNFDGADLSGATFTRSTIGPCSFKGASLFGANLAWAHLYACDFLNADLRNANLTGASLIGCRFQGADLAYSTVMGALYYHDTFAGAKSLPEQPVFLNPGRGPDPKFWKEHWPKLWKEHWS